MAEEQELNTLNFSAKSVAKYALLPGILPRLQRMTTHLSQFLFMFTQIFGSVGLIDKNHPCLRPENIGRYRFRDIIGLAASNVVFDKKHIPQIVMFFVVVLSIVLSAAIVLGLIASTVFTVHAAEAQFFGAPKENGYQESSDWALKFLFRIFGETSFFHKPPSGQALGNPWFTSILVGMLKYYSLAMLVIAAFMVLYILIITLTESARSGEPFGSRFDGIWAPVRLALALGLLVPMTTAGYNGAQLITFQSALWGSNLATNVWYGGLDTMKQGSQKFFSSTMSDPGYRFIRDIFLVNLCVDGLTKQSKTKTTNIDVGEMQYKAVVGKETITYSFGPEKSPDFCGRVTVLKSPNALGDSVLAKPAGLQGVTWPEKTVMAYLTIAQKFLPVPPADQPDGTKLPLIRSGKAEVQGDMKGLVNYISDEVIGKNSGSGDDKLFIKTMNDDGKYDAEEIKKWVVNDYWTPLGVTVSGDSSSGYTKTPFFSTTEYQTLISNYNTWLISSLMKDAAYGWTTAGVFYLRMSSAMATISKVVNTPPTVTQLPSNLSKSFATAGNPTANSQATAALACSGALNTFFGWFGGGDATCMKYKYSLQANSFLQGGKAWFSSAVQASPAVYGLMDTSTFDRSIELGEPQTSTNLQAGIIMEPVLDTLSDMAHIDSKDLNPLGAVINWGNSLINVAMVAYLIGLIGLGNGLTSLAFSIGTTLMLPGFILAFWVPTIPFMHFTFAVIEWMISVLEAVIGMPLWCLSLITLEGDGLGDLGMSGVKRLFEIILRPSIIVISLIVSVIIFSAGVSFFNEAMALYGSASSQANVNQNVMQSSVAGLGMIFVYMFGIYTLATSCFKLIDSIPDKFGRWMGLEGGFGSQIKTGMGSLQDLIVAGAAFNGLNSIGKAGGGVAKDQRAINAKAKADKKDKEG